jgi:O-antigen ligase
MTSIPHTWTNTRFLFVALVTSVVTALGMLKFSPALFLLLYASPFLIAPFYYYPIALISLWFALYFVASVFRDMMNEVGSFYLIPMDPAYYFSVIFLITYLLTRGKEFIRAIKANPFLIVLLAIILGYILIYMPIYGKQSLGEARKVYFIFFFPLLTFLSTKSFNDPRRLLFLTFFLTLALLTICLVRFKTVSSMKETISAQMALVFLFTMFSIMIFHLNGRVILHRIVDLAILGLCFTFVVLSQHRSVVIAAAFGLLLMCVLAQNKILFFSRIGFASLAFFAVIGVILSLSPEFEDRTVKRLSGIINPYSDNTASWRIKGWSRQLGTLSTNDLLLGQGLGSYYQAFNTFEKRDTRAPRTMIEPHNAYVTIIANFGLLGLVVYELLAFWFIWRLFAVRKALPRGTMRAYVEMSILNFGAGQAFMLGYGFCFPILIFLGMGMSTIKLLEDSWHIGEQDKEWKISQTQID